MASLYFRGKKAPKEEAKRKLMEHIADNWIGGFTVDFWTDGGGPLIRAVLEMENPDERIGDELRSKFDAVWMGWRLVVLKVPIGHIEVFHKP